MTTFNKILSPVYSAITACVKQEDGSVSVKYVIGTGADSGDTVTNFTPIVTEYKWIDAETAKSVLDKPLTKDDIGKTTEQLDIERVYIYLRESGQIVV